MKKLLFFAVVIFAACENHDDDVEPQCVNKLWELVAIGQCNPNIAGDCTYLATYGETEETAGTVEVDQSTYDYYTERGNTSDGSLCWEGTQE